MNYDVTPNLLRIALMKKDFGSIQRELSQLNRRQCFLELKRCFEDNFTRVLPTLRNNDVLSTIMESLQEQDRLPLLVTRFSCGGEIGKPFNLSHHDVLRLHF